MPRYFVHIHDGEDILDEEGTELPNDDVAQSQSILTAGDLLRELNGKVWDGNEWRITAVREDGAKICEIRFSASLNGNHTS